MRNEINNANLNEISIEILNSMEYIFNDDSDNEVYNQSIQCNYLTPDQNLGTVNHFSAMGFNIGSVQTKWDNFNAELHDIYNKCEAIGLCETHLTSSSEKLYSIEGYECFTTNIASNKGGVCLYVRSGLGCKVRDDLVLAKNHIEAIFVECLVNKKTLVIGMIYHRPGTSSEHFFEDLNTLLENINSNCIIMGDFNINLLNYDNNLLT